MTSWKYIIEISFKALTLISLLTFTSGMTEHDVIHPIPWKRECIHDNRTQCHMPGHPKEIARREHCYKCPGTAYCVTDHVTNLTYYICLSDEEIMCDPGYYGRFTRVNNKIRFEKLTCQSGTYLAVKRDCRRRKCKPYDRIDPTEYTLERQQQFNGEAAQVSCVEGLCPEPDIAQPFKYRAAVCKTCPSQTKKPNAGHREIVTSTPVPSTMAAITTAKTTTLPKPDTTAMARQKPRPQRKSTKNPNILAKADLQNGESMPFWGWIIIGFLLLLTITIVVVCLKRGYFCNKQRRELEEDLRKTKDGSSDRLIDKPDNLEKESKGSTAQTVINQSFTVKKGGSLYYSEKTKNVTIESGSQASRPSLTTSQNGEITVTIQDKEEETELTSPNGDTVVVDIEATDTTPVQASDDGVSQTSNTSQEARATDDSLIQVETNDTGQASSQADSVETDGSQTRHHIREGGDDDETNAKTIYEVEQSLADGAQPMSDRDVASVQTDSEETSPKTLADEQSDSDTDSEQSSSDQTETSQSEEEDITLGATAPGRFMPLSNGNISTRTRHVSCGDNMLDATAPLIPVKA